MRKRDEEEGREEASLKQAVPSVKACRKQEAKLRPFSNLDSGWSSSVFCSPLILKRSGFIGNGADSGCATDAFITQWQYTFIMGGWIRQSCDWFIVDVQILNYGCWNGVGLQVLFQQQNWFRQNTFQWRALANTALSPFGLHKWRGIS